MLRSFSLAVAFAAATTVMVATRIGIPISTTHALTGALIGAGWFTSPSGVNLAKLGTGFFAPLIISPVLAIVACTLLYPLLRWAREGLGVKKETCLCIGTEVVALLPAGIGRDQVLTMRQTQTLPSVSLDTEATCQERYSGPLLGLSAHSTLDALHFLSAGMVSFARGLNDTPKIAAMLQIGRAHV